jgi:hypothetical protein
MISSAGDRRPSDWLPGRPPQISDSVVVIVSWVDAKFSQALINAADAMAPTLATMLDAA